MTMVLDNHNRQYGGMGYDSNMYQNQMHAPPHFTDPWAAHSSANTTSSLYHTGLPSSSLQSKQEAPRPTNIPLPYSNIPTSTGPLVSGSEYSTSIYPGPDSLSIPQDIPRTSYAAEQQSYPATAPPSSSYTPSPYSSLNYAQSLHSQQQDQSRRMSSNTDPNGRAAHATFGELDSARGMLALSSQNIADLTPRNIYEARTQRGSTDSYGFPSNASSNSSFSMASGRDYPYYSASVASTDSATDYSSAASDAGYDSMTNSRTLPRPSQLIGANLPPAPQSMMSQFSSKMSNSTQKKHKCKVCDKRFTRPSSLQTHMYSHTGEKPFACDVEGCGRHFSVVSNLRRHKKVHKGEVLEHTSDDEE